MLFLWEFRQPTDQPPVPWTEVSIGWDEPFDIFDSSCMERHYFRLPGMIHAMCRSLAARMGQRLA